MVAHTTLLEIPCHGSYYTGCQPCPIQMQGLCYEVFLKIYIAQICGQAKKNFEFKNVLITFFFLKRLCIRTKDNVSAETSYSV